MELLKYCFENKIAMFASADDDGRYMLHFRKGNKALDHMINPVDFGFFSDTYIERTLIGILEKSFQEVDDDAAIGLTTKKGD